MPTIINHYNKYWGYSPTVNDIGGYSDLMFIDISGVHARGYHYPPDPETPHYYYRTYINGELALVTPFWFIPSIPADEITIGISFTGNGLEPNVEHTIAIEEVLTLNHDGTGILDTTMGPSYSFTILQPAKPTIVLPTDEQINTVWNDTLVWADGGNAEQYQVFVSRSPNYSDYPYSLYRGRVTKWANLEGQGWQTTTYTLRTNNPDIYEGFNDYDQIQPYYNTIVYWRVDAYSEWGYATGDVWSFAIAAIDYVPPIPPFPSSRPDDYNPDLPWLPGEWNGTYTPPEWGEPTDYVATGGGRWGRQLVVVGKSLVYYESLI